MPPNAPANPVQPNAPGNPPPPGTPENQPQPNPHVNPHQPNAPGSQPQVNGPSGQAQPGAQGSQPPPNAPGSPPQPYAQGDPSQSNPQQPNLPGGSSPQPNSPESPQPNGPGSLPQPGSPANPPQPNAGNPAPPNPPGNPVGPPNAGSPDSGSETPPGVGALPVGAITTPGGTVTAPNAGPTLVFGTQTLAPGGPPITLSGLPVSLAPDGNHVVAAGVTNTIARPSSTAGAPPVGTPATAFAFGGSTITLDAATRAVINGQTIQPGGLPATVSGTPISLVADGGRVVIGTSTAKLFKLPTATAGPAFALGGSTIYRNTASAFVVDGHTIAPGGPAITVAGTPVSLAADATHVVVGSATQDIFTVTPSPQPTQPTGLAHGSQTLTAGGPGVTVSGTVISLVTDGSAVVVGTQTKLIGPQNTDVSVGGDVWTVFGAASTTPSSTLCVTVAATAIPTSSGVTATAATTSSATIGAASRYGRSLPLWPAFVLGYLAL